MRNFREMANRYRDFSLIDVLNFLGAEHDNADRQRWDLSNKSVWIGKDEDCQRFYDHKTGVGGGGAIDLVSHLQGCDFKSALEILARFSVNSENVPNTGLKSKPNFPVDQNQFIPPIADPRYLANIVKYMLLERSITKPIVQEQINLGKMYADSRRNIIFLCNDEAGLVTGAEIRGTGNTLYKGMAAGSQRGKGFFTISHPNPVSLVVVESAIDALSYKVIFPDEPSVVVSTAGVLPACPALAKLAKVLNVSEIVIAYDNDHAGDENAVKLIFSLENTGFICRRFSPDFKDWNEYLAYCLDLDVLFAESKWIR